MRCAIRVEFKNLGDGADKDVGPLLICKPANKKHNRCPNTHFADFMQATTCISRNFLHSGHVRTNINDAYRIPCQIVLLVHQLSQFDVADSPEIYEPLSYFGAKHGIAASWIRRFNSVDDWEPRNDMFDRLRCPVSNLRVHDIHAIDAMVEDDVQQPFDHVGGF